jgi:hypothetical protein
VEWTTKEAARNGLPFEESFAAMDTACQAVGAGYWSILQLKILKAKYVQEIAWKKTGYTRTSDAIWFRLRAANGDRRGR